MHGLAIELGHHNHLSDVVVARLACFVTSLIVDVVVVSHLPTTSCVVDGHRYSRGEYSDLLQMGRSAMMGAAWGVLIADRAERAGVTSPRKL